jgi:parallel beta-helix repeat protein
MSWFATEPTANSWRGDHGHSLVRVLIGRARTLSTGPNACWTTSRRSTTVALEVAAIVRAPSGTTPAVPRLDAADTSGDAESYANPEPTAASARPAPGRAVIRGSRRALVAASIALLLAVTGVIGLPAWLGPHATVDDQGPGGPGPLSLGPAVEPSSVAPSSPAATPPRTSVVAPVWVSPNRWVATTGSDSADGSANSPWRTIQHAVDATQSGGVIAVHSGTYGHFVIKRSGLVVEGAPGESAIVSGGTYVVLIQGVSSATIRHLTIQKAPNRWGSGIRIEESQNVEVESNLIRENHSFGVKVKDATNVLITDNEIRNNDTGIELSGSVGGALIVGNRIHHNNHMVTRTRGGNGIVFTKTSGAIEVSGNRLWGNRARHLTGSGYDGGAFEVYAASNLLITGNVMWDNNNVMETGTDGSAPCSHITFTRNIAYGPGRVPRNTQGLILRCASSSLFANNTFDGLDTFAFYLTDSGKFAGSIGGLRIESNIIVRGRSYSLARGLPRSVRIDYNLSLPGGSAAQYAKYIAYVEGRGNTDSLAEFRSWTRFDRHGVHANPRFIDRAKHDYRLRSGSPAIDAGAPGVGGAFIGKSPDIGRFERGG